MNFILALKRPFTVDSGIFYEGRDESDLKIICFDPVARVLAHVNIETVTKRYLSQK